MLALQILGMGVEIAVGAGVAVAALAFLLLRKWFPSLRVAGGPVERAALRRAENAEHELGLANDEIVELEKARAALERERSLAAVIDLVMKVAVGVDKTLEKLAELNGGLNHAADGLKETNANLQASTKAIEFLAGQIINRSS